MNTLLSPAPLSRLDAPGPVSPVPAGRSHAEVISRSHGRHFAVDLPEKLFNPDVHISEWIWQVIWQVSAIGAYPGANHA